MMEDGWPFVTVLWGMVSNHHVLHWLKTVVVSDVEKASHTPKAWVTLASLNIRLASRHATCGQPRARQNSTCIASSSDLNIADSPRSGRNSLAQRATLGS